MMNSEFNKREMRTTVSRLNVLAEFLMNEVKPSKFNMNNWAELPDGSLTEKSSHKDVVKIMEETSNLCGTAACALGWAGTIPAFNRAGLKMVPIKSNCGSDSAYVTYSSASGNIQGFQAAEQFFKLTEEEAESIFDPSSYDDNSWTYNKITRSKVVRHIKKIIKSREKELLAA